MGVGDVDRKVPSGPERAQATLLQFHVKHSVSWQIAGSLRETTGLAKDRGVGRRMEQMVWVQGAHGPSDSLPSRRGASRRTVSGAAPRPPPSPCGLALLQNGGQRVGPELRATRRSAANPLTPPGSRYSLSRHLPWLLLAFKIHAKEAGLV